jgi:hypothetical protein
MHKASTARALWTNHGRQVTAPPAVTYPREAFIPAESPYLGQAVLGEPVRRTNVLF